MSSLLRVVLDTNIVLSALVFNDGLAGRVRLAWQNGVILPLACTATVKELMRVLAYPKFRLSSQQQQQQELLADYLPYVQTVTIPQSVPLVPDCRDPLDLTFMHLAVAGKAQLLVSGDRDLLAIAAAFESLSGCPILSLEAFSRLHLSS
jgi:putative PIN family toxin of toxin-antitoxin system